MGRGIKLYRITGAGQRNRVFIDSKQYKEHKEMGSERDPAMGPPDRHQVQEAPSAPVQTRLLYPNN